MCSLFLGVEQKDLFDAQGGHISLLLKEIVNHQTRKATSLSTYLFGSKLINRGIFQEDRQIINKLQALKMAFVGKLAQTIKDLDDPTSQIYTNKFMQGSKEELTRLMQEDMGHLAEEIIILLVPGTITTSQFIHNVLLDLEKNQDKKDRL